MDSIKVRALLSIAFLLSACTRHEASPGEARKVVASCGMTVVEVAGASGFDFVGTAIQVKKLPEDEFSRKMTCVDWTLFSQRLKRDDVIVENGPYDPLKSQDPYQFNSSFSGNFSD